MPIPELNITDNIKGLPRQLVPLRYAVLVTGLPAKTMIEMLTKAYEIGIDISISLLNAYEYSGGKIRPCSATHFDTLLERMRQSRSEKAQMKLLPAHWFVYSEDLVFAFSNWIDLTMDRDTAAESGMCLSWNPPIYPYDAEIKACTLIKVPLSELSPREKRSRATEQKHGAWYKEYSELKKPHSKYSDSQISKIIAKKYGANERTIRRVISSQKKAKT